MKEEQKQYEALWIKINSGSVKVRIGTVFASQENKCKNADLKQMYDSIAEEIGKLEDDEKLLIMGDFNCKISSIIRNNKEEVTRSGTELLKLVKQHNLEFLNCHIA